MSDETTQTDAAQPVVAAPTATPLLPKPPASEKSSLNTILVVIIVILGGLIVANGVTKYFPGFGASAPVAVLDSDLVSAAGIHDLLQRAPSMTPEAVEAESKKRAEALQHTLADLRQRGYIVIDRTAALSWPAAADITEQTATNLAIPPAALQAVRDRRAEQQRLARTGNAAWPPTSSAPAEKTISGSNLD